MLEIIDTVAELIEIKLMPVSQDQGSQYGRLA